MRSSSRRWRAASAGALRRCARRTSAARTVGPDGRRSRRVTSRRSGPRRARAPAGCRRGRGDATDRGEVVLLEDGPWPHRPGPFDEQLGGWRSRGPRPRASLRGVSSGADGDLHLVGDRECFTAGGQDRHVRAPTQDFVDQGGSSIDHVLAVVDQQQESASRPGSRSAVHVRRGRRLPRPEARRERRPRRAGTWSGCRQGRGGPPTRRRGSHRRRWRTWPGPVTSSRAAGADQRQQPSLVDKCDQGVELGVAADQRSHYRREVRGREVTPPSLARCADTATGAGGAGRTGRRAMGPGAAPVRAGTAGTTRARGPGTRPGLSRVRGYTSRASACRPLRYRATISSPASDSRVGSCATTGSRSATTSAWRPSDERDLGPLGQGGEAA